MFSEWSLGNFVPWRGVGVVATTLALAWAVKQAGKLSKKRR